MSDPVFSFVFDRQSARNAFKQVGATSFLLATLAQVTPEPPWEGCLVYEGESPLDSTKTACIGLRGPAADVVQQRLVEVMERLGVRILELYDGGPEVRERIAQVRDGRWASAQQGR
jgi:hypothetical protein